MFLKIQHDHTQDRICIIKARTKVFKNDIAINGTQMWSTLKPGVRNSNSLSKSKKESKT